MITEQKVINALRDMPPEQKDLLAAQATLRGVSIEKQLVPTLANLLRGFEVVMAPYLENRRFLK